MFLYDFLLLAAIVCVWIGESIQTRILALAIAAVERGITDILRGIVDPLATIVENCNTPREKRYSTIAAEIVYENFELLRGMLDVELRYSLMASAAALGGFESEEGEFFDVNWKQHAREKGVGLLYVVACDDCGLFLRSVCSKTACRLVTQCTPLTCARKAFYFVFRFLLKLLETSKVSGEHSTALLALIRIIELKPDVVSSHLAPAGKALQVRSYTVARSTMDLDVLYKVTLQVITVYVLKNRLLWRVMKFARIAWQQQRPQFKLWLLHFPTQRFTKARCVWLWGILRTPWQ